MQNLSITRKVIVFIIEAIEKKVYKRKWTYSQQVIRARLEINEDAQWMAHDERVRAVSMRHLSMLQPSWYSTALMSTSNFRDSIGLDPHQRKDNDK